jgi:putative membrane protein
MNRILSARIVRILLVALVPAVVLGVFVAALAAADNGTARVPAALVNNDQLIQQKATDGSTTTIAAGRLVVTGLTKPTDPKSGASVDWRLSNSAQAADLLKQGKVYAIVTIPKGFSKSIATLSGSSPKQAEIRIRTDDAHGTLVSQLGGIIGNVVSASVGSQLSSSVVQGLYGGFGSVRTSLVKAGDGANKLGDGADALSSGLSKAADGGDAVAGGVRSLGTGAAKLSTGADSLASGLDKAASGAASAAGGARSLSSGVDRYTDGVSSYTKGVSSFLTGVAPAFDPSVAAAQSKLAGGSAAIAAQLKQLAAAPPSPRTSAALTALAAQLQQVSSGQAQLAAGSKQLSAAAAGATKLQSAGAALRSGGTKLDSGASSLATGLGALPAGIRSAASGARSLGTGAAQLATGAGSLATGASQLSSGVRKSATGASSLADGADKLGSGLKSGAEQVPSLTKAQQKQAGKVVANPVTASATRDNALSSPGEIVATLIIPVGLWIGAAALVLLFGAVRRRLLSTGVGTVRLVGGTLLRGAVVAIAQAVIVVVLLQATLTIAWSAVPLAFLVSVVAGVAFLAIHQLLQAIFGRAGTVLSIVLLGVQLVAVGGIYPIQLVAAPFQAISPFLPLTAAVSAVQALITGSSGATVAGGIVSLVLWALIAFGLTVAIVGRRRTSVGMFAAQGALPA